MDESSEAKAKRRHVAVDGSVNLHDGQDTSYSTTPASPTSTASGASITLNIHIHNNLSPILMDRTFGADVWKQMVQHVIQGLGKAQ
jgi:hypothetical protein